MRASPFNSIGCRHLPRAAVIFTALVVGVGGTIVLLPKQSPPPVKPAGDGRVGVTRHRQP